VRVLQLLAEARLDDAVTSQALRIERALRELGHEAALGADAVAPELEGSVEPAPTRLRQSWDLVLDHYSIGADYHDPLQESGLRCWLVYHNITPAALLAPWSPSIAAKCAEGRTRLAQLLPRYELALADSTFNAEEIHALRGAGRGGPERVEILPICVEVPPEASRAPLRTVSRCFAGRGPLLLFVGRIAPQKNHFALLRMVHALREDGMPGAELLLPGDSRGFEGYERALRDEARRLGLEAAVHLLGKVPAAELWSLYRVADVLCCVSAHEGFCVPIVEAFLAGLPVVAARGTAVAETAADAAMLAETADPAEIGAMCRAVLEDRRLADTLRQQGRERARRFSFEALLERLERLFGHALPSGSATISPCRG
jgi:L-malate glycosyltransferase